MRALIPHLPVREKTMTLYVSKKVEFKLKHSRISKKRKRKRRVRRFRIKIKIRIRIKIRCIYKRAN